MVYTQIHFNAVAALKSIVLWRLLQEHIAECSIRWKSTLEGLLKTCRNFLRMLTSLLTDIQYNRNSNALKKNGLHGRTPQETIAFKEILLHIWSAIEHLDAPQHFWWNIPCSWNQSWIVGRKRHQNLIPTVRGVSTMACVATLRLRHLVIIDGKINSKSI